MATYEEQDSRGGTDRSDSAPRRMTMREQQIVLESVQEFAALQSYRAIHAEQWEEAAQLIRPTSRNTFYYGNYEFPGMKKTDRQVDVSGALSNIRFAAILDSLLTPRNMTWHGLGSDLDYIKKDRDTKLWFEAVTKVLFKHRYAPIGNFSSQNQNVYEELGAFGTGVLFIDQAVDEAGFPLPSLRYKNLPLGQVYLRENHQGLVNGFCRWYRLTGQQAVTQFKDRCPPQLREAAEKSSQTPFDFLHRVCPNGEFDAKRLDVKGKRFYSYNICLTTNELVSEGGYRSFPITASRYLQTPGEVYGRGPATLALPALKTLNAEKRDFLVQGHRAASPVLLTEDDGMVGLSLRPGAMNAGGMKDGKMTVGVLPSGNIQVSKEMMDEERASIDGFFLVDLFKVLLGDPKIFTATQIVEMMAQRGILIAPTVGRQQDEYLGPLIDREIDLCIQMRLLPPMPPALREARGDYKVNYTSPLSRDMRAGEVAGFTRSLETTLSIVNATQDPAPLDNYDFDIIIPAVSDIQGVPESWMASPEKMAAIRAARAQAQHAQQQIQAAPAQAALIKAKAVAAEKGGGGLPQPGIQAPLPAPGAPPGGQG